MNKKQMIVTAVAIAFSILAIVWASNAIAQEPKTSLQFTFPKIEIGPVQEDDGSTPMPPQISFETSVSPQEMMNECVMDTLMTSWGYGAGYGAGLGTVVGLLGVAQAPLGAFTLATGAIFVGLNTFFGGSLGLGASALSTIGLESTHPDAISRLCREKVAQQLVASDLDRARNMVKALVR